MKGHREPLNKNEEISNDNNVARACREPLGGAKITTSTTDCTTMELNDGNSPLRTEFIWKKIPLSLVYPGQCYSGFGTNIICDPETKTVVFQLTNDRDPRFICPYITLKFRVIQKKRFLIKAKEMWIADVTLTNCSNLYRDDDTKFVACVSVAKTKYETTLIIQPEDKRHHLHDLCSRKWKLRLYFQYNESKLGDEIVSCIVNDFKIPLKIKNK
jgi:hypothetical protein